jgi:hypothetical protein
MAYIIWALKSCVPCYKRRVNFRFVHAESLNDSNPNMHAGVYVLMCAGLRKAEEYVPCESACMRARAFFFCRKKKEAFVIAFLATTESSSRTIRIHTLKLLLSRELGKAFSFECLSDVRGCAMGRHATNGYRNRVRRVTVHGLSTTSSCERP